MHYIFSAVKKHKHHKPNKKIQSRKHQTCQVQLENEVKKVIKQFNVSHEQCTYFCQNCLEPLRFFKMLIGKWFTAFQCYDLHWIETQIDTSDLQHQHHTKEKGILPIL